MNKTNGNPLFKSFPLMLNACLPDYENAGRATKLWNVVKRKKLQVANI